MPVFVSTDLPGPENFHEVARLRPVEIIEVLSKLQLIKKAGRAGPFAFQRPQMPSPSC